MKLHERSARLEQGLDAAGVSPLLLSLPAIESGCSAALDTLSRFGGKDTAGQFAVVEHRWRRADSSTHTSTSAKDELSHVLEGQIGARVGDEEVTVGPGCDVLKPRRVPHTFWNPGPGPARILEIISPGGFERYFEQAPEVARRTTTAQAGMTPGRWG